MIESKPAQFKDRPYIGVGVMVWSGNKLLLGQRKNLQDEGNWQFPGGHLETGETILECARREVGEESGIKIGDIFHAGFTGNVFKRDGRQYVTLFVSAKYISGDVKVLEPDKCRCWKWFTYMSCRHRFFCQLQTFWSRFRIWEFSVMLRIFKQACIGKVSYCPDNFNSNCLELWIGNPCPRHAVNTSLYARMPRPCGIRSLATVTNPWLLTIKLS